MHTMHGLIKRNLRRMEKEDLATSLGFGIVRGVDPRDSRYPTRTFEGRVDVLVVQEMYAFGAHVAFRAVVPARSSRARTDTSDKLLYFLLESLYLLLAFGLRLFAGFTTSVGTLVSFGACGSGSHHA